MKYFVEEITVLKDGAIAKAITEKENDREAFSAYCQVLSSAAVNANVVSVHAEVKDEHGNLSECKTKVFDIK